MYSKASWVTIITQSEWGELIIIANFIVVPLFLVFLVLIALVKASKKETAKSDTGSPTVMSQSAVAPKGDLSSDCELVAVIAAAIAAAEGRASTEGLVVRSIRYKRKAGVRRLA
jgi:Na+-transporting methylmalonyl-CoA/oxaloacetate decarboxylase gamma subunit